MSTLIDTERYSIVAPYHVFAMLNRPRSLDKEIGAPVFAEALPSSLPQIAPEAVLIDFPDFHFQLPVPIIEFEVDFKPAEKMVENVKVAIDRDVFLLLSLTGKLIEGNKFQIDQTLISTEWSEERSRDYFTISTFWAALYLAENVCFQIPEIKLDLNLNYDQPLLEISNLLQGRQTAYRLMVIECATGKQFQLPSDFEMEPIIFTYRAIVDRSFVWPIDQIKLRTFATQESLAELFSNDHPFRTEIPLKSMSKAVLGESISLGQGTMIIEDFFIQNADEVRRELAMNDGRLVEVIAGSLSGQALFELPEAPRLPNEPWDSNIQVLIDLESQLDARLVERYHALAAATLADLTEEEKKEVTARTRLDEGNRIFNFILDMFESLARSLQTFGHKLLILLRLRN